MAERDDKEPPSLWRRCAAEAVGAFFLTLVGAGLEVVDALHPGDIDRLMKSAGPALVVAAMIYAIGDVSGAHLNPAVTAMFAARGVFDVRGLPAYWLAQLGGAIGAAGLLRGLFGTVGHVGTNRTDLSAWRAFVVEAVLTAFLAIVIVNAAHRHSLIGADAALPVAATLTACGLFGGELTTASLNPARALGPAIVAGRFTDIWVFVAGPFAGAMAGLAVASILRPVPNPDERASAEGK